MLLKTWLQYIYFCDVFYLILHCQMNPGFKIPAGKVIWVLWSQRAARSTGRKEQVPPVQEDTTERRVARIVFIVIFLPVVTPEIVLILLPF